MNNAVVRFGANQSALKAPEHSWLRKLPAIEIVDSDVRVNVRVEPQAVFAPR